MKRKISALGACVGMLLLILDGKTALMGARTGVELCIQAVVPSLFPFFVLSGLLTACPMPRGLGRLLGFPKGAEALAVPAFLGGYPVGAQSVGEAYHTGGLHKEDAEHLLAFCNNAGPAFLFGMAGSLFPKAWMAWALWIIHLVSALMVSRLFPVKAAPVSLSKDQPVSISDALSSAVRVMGLVCGWIVLFRVIVAFLERWVFFLLPTEAQAAATGLLELANGCFALPKVESIRLRFVLCSGLLAAGGLCVTMQTLSVTQGLSLKFYFLGKVLQTVFSLLLCGCLFRGNLFIPVTIFLYFALILASRQKRGSIPKPIIV